MHISQLNEVQKLNAELTAVRAQITAVVDTGLRICATNGARLSISENMTETFAKLVMIELTDLEANLVDQLENLGVDVDELAECACAENGAFARTELNSPADVLSVLFGISGMHRGGVVGARG